MKFTRLALLCLRIELFDVKPSDTAKGPKKPEVAGEEANLSKKLTLFGAY